ncbi:unnamed protein product [Ectocarpus sp. CCAP 1310/34]|nr:unnamed protein product [Ectocarpus sp. CCAP 1310/34]
MFREFNNYWWFGGGRSEEVDALMDSQHPQGKRGAPLRRRLCQGGYISISNRNAAFQSPSSINLSKSKDEMQVGFERVRLVDAAEEAERKAQEDIEQERLRQLAEAEAAAKAAEAAAAAATAAAARGVNGDSSTRRSSRKRPGPSSPVRCSCENVNVFAGVGFDASGKSVAVRMTTADLPVGALERRAQGSNGNNNSNSSNSSNSSRMEAARAAAEAEAAQPYVPLLPAWRHVARREDRGFLRNLKLELISLEEQAG